MVFIFSSATVLVQTLFSIALAKMSFMKKRIEYILALFIFISLNMIVSLLNKLISIFPTLVANTLFSSEGLTVYLHVVPNIYTLVFQGMMFILLIFVTTYMIDKKIEI